MADSEQSEVFEYTTLACTDVSLGLMVQRFTNHATTITTTFVLSAKTAKAIFACEALARLAR